MNIPYVFKRCTKCWNLLVFNSTNFPKDKNCKYGLRRECKKCFSERKRKEVKARKFKEMEQISTKNKKCSGCGKTLSYKSFYKNHRNKDGLSHKCKSCITEQNKRYQLKELGKRGW